MQSQNNGSRFVSLGHKLSVLLQTEIPEENREKILKQISELNNGVSVNSEKGQVFHPVLSACENEIIFVSLQGAEGLRRKFVLRAKHWTAAARFGEDETFGFEGTKPGAGYKGIGHLKLAYPGLIGVFSPLYLKVRPKTVNGKSQILYLQIEAGDCDAGVRVVSRKLDPRQEIIPRHLIAAL